LITLECGHCHGKLEFAKVPGFFTWRYCGYFTKESEVSVNVTVNTERRTQIQTITVRVEELDALIQRWSLNGWRVKSVNHFTRFEGYFGAQPNNNYSTVIFDREVQ